MPKPKSIIIHLNKAMLSGSLFWIFTILPAPRREMIHENWEQTLSISLYNWISQILSIFRHVFLFRLVSPRFVLKVSVNSWARSLSKCTRLVKGNILCFNWKCRNFLEFQFHAVRSFLQDELSILGNVKSRSIKHRGTAGLQRGYPFGVAAATLSGKAVRSEQFVCSI